MLTRGIRIAGLVAGCLATIACDKPTEDVVPIQKPELPPVKSDKAPEPKPPAEPKAPPAPVRKPLDLSMPPQPRYPSDAGERATAQPAPLLPDLFEQQKQRDERAIRLDAGVLMQESVDGGLDAVDGGQVEVEVPTR